jgi:hypothetical protein
MPFRLSSSPPGQESDPSALREVGLSSEPIMNAISSNVRFPARRVPIPALAGIVFLGLVAFGIDPVLAQNANGQGIQGAWVGQGLKCDDIFSSKGAYPRFRKPVNIFAPALIITGKRLVTPQASCRLRSVNPQGDRSVVTLDCANSVSLATTKVYLARTPDGSLVRYYDENDTSGSRYIACSR